MSENYFNITLFSMAKSRKLICGFFKQVYFARSEIQTSPSPNKKGKEQTKTQNKFAANQGTSNVYIIELHFK